MADTATVLGREPPPTPVEPSKRLPVMCFTLQSDVRRHRSKRAAVWDKQCTCGGHLQRLQQLQLRVGG